MAIDTAPVSTRTVLGYARVSTGHQSLDQQVDALTSAGVDPTRVYSDKLSGTSTREQRPGLSALLEYARRATPSSRPCSSGPARASRAFPGRG
jgi:predicted site-specific integrase-resolvase